MKPQAFAPLFVAAIFVAVGLGGRMASANPNGERVVAGAASFKRDGGSLSITTGDRAIIHWQDFSIAGGELTKFLQPSSSSATLNRVIGGVPSSILGTLQANGKIFLINPNGILIGPGGRVDTAGFLASTLDITNQEFLGGGDLNFLGSSTARVINQGAINAIGGDVFLIGRQVENQGTITASGVAALAAGTEVLLRQSGSERVFVQPSAAGTKAGAGVVNSGTITAAAAELKAHGNLYALAINHTGAIRATGVKAGGGRVYLTSNGGAIEQAGTISARQADGGGGAIAVQAGAGGAVKVSGTLDASGRKTGARGGTVRVAAEVVELSATALVDASGDTQGGGVTLGGDRGASDAAKSARLTVAPGARMQADAVSSGDGGTVTLWSGGTTDFQGQISARGAGAAGAGGSAEVSGVASVNFRGTVDLRARGGKTGTLLLDPTDAEVNTVATVPDATLLTPAAITAQVALSNVVVSTSGAGPGSGHLFINAPVLFESGNSLSFLAHGSFLANASVQNSGAGAVNVVAGWDGSTGFAGPGGLASSNLDLAQILATPASYGNGGGSIFLGGSTSTGGVALGSRFGATNLAAHDLTLRGSDTTANAFAQLGFRADPTMAYFHIDSPITVVLKNDLTAEGGGETSSYAQLGHGGAALGPNGGNFAGDISIRAGGNLALVGGGASAYAQLGHGDAAGTSIGIRSGRIDAQVTGETSLANGGARWLLGHETRTRNGRSDAPVALTTGTMDFDAGTTTTRAEISGAAGSDFAAKWIGNLAGGDVSLHLTNPTPGAAGGLRIGSNFIYNSGNDLTFISDQDLRIDAGVTIQNTAGGTMTFVADQGATPLVGRGVFRNDGTISSAGDLRIFGASPSQVQLGSVVLPHQQFGTFFSSTPAFAGSGVLFKTPPSAVPPRLLPEVIAEPAPPPPPPEVPFVVTGNGFFILNGQFFNVMQDFDLGIVSNSTRVAPKKVAGSTESTRAPIHPPSTGVARAPASGKKPGVVGPFRLSSGQVP